MMFQTIFFRKPEQNLPLQAYQVGLMGCESIEDIKHDDGSYSYRVTFDNGEHVIIDDAILVIE